MISKRDHEGIFLVILPTPKDSRKLGPGQRSKKTRPMVATASRS